MLNDELRYKLFKLIEENPGLSQRDVARAMGVSLGKVNYCLNALISKGWVKVSNFKNSRNKIAYRYLLTPRGILERAAVTARFLQLKMAEHDALKDEIEALGLKSGEGPHTR
jgi:EPS-associated MarR family transcriptional regulator